MSRHLGIPHLLPAAVISILAISLVTNLSPPPARADGPADCLVGALSLDRFKAVIQDLAAYETRYWRRPKNALAAQDVYDRLVSYGYANVTFDEFTHDGVVRHNIYATRIGATNPLEMYIVGAHLDSYNAHGDFAHCPGADDDASGVAAVLEAARVFAHARTETSVRFAIWNAEEIGLIGSNSYVARRRGLQGAPEEPTWLGMIQLDMILYDHGPGPIPDADVEYQALHDFGGEAIILAHHVAGAMSRYGAIPAEVGDNMRNTDSVPFQTHTAAISIRENRRIGEIGGGSNPHWHEPTDRFETFSEQDYEFGFNIVKMLVGAVGELVYATPLGDLDRDGDVEGDDLTALLASYGLGDGAAGFNPDADLNADGVVNLPDLAELLGNYGCGE